MADSTLSSPETISRLGISSCWAQATVIVSPGDDLDPRPLEIPQAGLALRGAVDGADLEVVLHDVPEHIRRPGDAGKAHHGQLLRHTLGQPDGPQDVVNRGHDVAHRNVLAVGPDGLCRAAPGDHGVNVVVQMLQHGVEPVLQVPHVDQQLHVAALGGDVCHQMEHPLVGRNAQKPQLLHGILLSLRPASRNPQVHYKGRLFKKQVVKSKKCFHLH